MNKKTTPYIYTFFLSLFCTYVFSQKQSTYSLQFSSQLDSETKFLNAFITQKSFNSENKIKSIKDSILSAVKKQGYYTIQVDSLSKTKNQYTYYIRLGEKIENATIHITTNNQELLSSLQLTIQNNYLHIPIEKLPQLLKQLQQHLLEKGEAFSQVSLSSISIHKKNLSASLSIKRSKTRTIDKIIIQGYPEHSPTFFHNYFNINSKKKVNSKILLEISQLTKQLDFIKEIKSPELLFSKDSTILYLYINKVKASTFDGLINFNTENNSIKFRGYIDLQLKNTFNKADKIGVYWKNNGNNRQEFNIHGALPYLLNSKLSSSATFNIYKHDTTYTNTAANLAISYPISNQLNIQLLANSETSSINNQHNSIEDYKKAGIGIGFDYRKHHKNNFFIHLGIFHKTRTTTRARSLYQVNLQSAITLPISKRLSAFLKNTSTYTSVNSNLENELFRSGGTRSLRGFQENSILSNSFSFINSELRIKTNTTSNLYSIHDIGIFNRDSKNQIFSAIGAGYSFIRGANRFNLEYIINNTSHNNVLKSATLSVKILTLF